MAEPAENVLTTETVIQEGQILAGPLFAEPMRVEEELEDAARERLEALLEAITLAGNAEQIREEIDKLRQLAEEAKAVEESNHQAKLARLRTIMHDEGFFDYDIPWNPNRLEQRMGRIHRYGQRHDCLIFNFVAANTIEGRVLQRLMDKLQEIRDALDDDAVFNVVGEVLPAAHVERVLRDYYAGKLGDADLEDRLLKDVDESHFRNICQTALEGLATRKLNLDMLVERRARAQERRVVPETIARFMKECARDAALALKPVGDLAHAFEPGRTPSGLKKYEREPGWTLAELAVRYPRLSQAEVRHAEVLARRERRREELERQRAMTLQGVERLASALVLPHPERETLDVQRLRPNPETERTAMRMVMEHERAENRQVCDVSARNLGYDVTSLDLRSSELRPIEVKGLAGATGSILLTPNERRVSEDRPDCYWLYVVTDCASTSALQPPVRDPARRPWREVTKVAHYCLSVDALKRPMEVREREGCYGEGVEP